MLAALIHQGILEHPAHGSGIGTELRRDALWQAAGELVHILQDAAARPVDVRAIFEQDIDIGEAEIREATYDGDAWGRQQRGDDGIGNLIFHEVWRAPHPGGVNNDLGVGDVRDGVDGDVPHGPPARHAQAKDNRNTMNRLRALKSIMRSTIPLSS